MPEPKINLLPEHREIFDSLANKTGTYFEYASGVFCSRCKDSLAEHFHDHNDKMRPKQCLTCPEGKCGGYMSLAKGFNPQSRKVA